MTSSSIFLLLRLAIGFVIDGLVLRRFLGRIHSIVLLFIPMRLRISQRSYAIQTRSNTVASFVLLLLTVFSINLGLYQIGQSLSNTSIGHKWIAIQRNYTIQNSSHTSGKNQQANLPKAIDVISEKNTQQSSNDVESFEWEELNETIPPNPSIVWPLKKRQFEFINKSKVFLVKRNDMQIFEEDI